MEQMESHDMTTSHTETAEVCEAVLTRILDADRLGALDAMRSWAGANSFERLANEVLVPVLDWFNREHMSACEAPIARGYVAAKVAEAAMRMIAEETTDADVAPTKGPVVIGNIEDDFHALGRRIVGTFLQAAGWRVEDMGSDVLAAEFVERAVEIGAHVIGVSAMMYTTAQGIRGVREELDRRGLSGQIKLAVGGAVFVVKPELVAAVGGDGTAITAVQAPPLFAQLWSAATGEDA